MTWPLFLELLAKSGAIAAIGLALSALLAFRPARDRTDILRASVCLLIALPIFMMVGPRLPLAWLAAEAPAAAIPAAQTWAVDLHPIASATVVGSIPARLSWPMIAALVYAAGLALIIARFAIGLWTLNRWTETGQPVAQRGWTEALNRLDAQGRTRLVSSSRIDAPLSWGLPPGVVLISPACLKRPETAPAVLAHELAHIRRGDWIFLTLSRLAVALFWFNPIVWVLHSSLCARTEEAADAAAVDQVDRQTYARTLVDLASNATSSPTPSLAISGPQKSLNQRITRLMTQQPKRPSRPLTMALIIGGLAAIATPLAALELTSASTEARLTEAVAGVHTEQAPSATASTAGFTTAALTTEPQPQAARLIRSSDVWIEAQTPPAPPPPPPLTARRARPAPPATPAPPPPPPLSARRALPAPPAPPAPPPPPPPPARLAALSPLPPMPPMPPVQGRGTYYYSSSNSSPDDIRAAARARVEAQAEAARARADAAGARSSTQAARIAGQQAREEGARARAQRESHEANRALAESSRAFAEQARAQAAVARDAARQSMVQARVEMRSGADQMDRGAEQMRGEGRKLTDPAYRAKIIADNRARGQVTTDAELIALSRRLPQQAEEMTRRAQDMRLRATQNP